METFKDKIESDPSFNNRFSIASKWCLKKAPLLWILPFHSISIKHNKRFNFLFEDFDKNLSSLSKTSDDYREFKIKLEYLSGLYCNSNKKAIYKVSATFHNEIMNLYNSNNDQKLDGLIYPSANTEGEGMNIVLRKEFITDENIECKLAILHFLKRNPVDHKKISYLPQAYAIPDEKGNLSFNAITQEFINGTSEDYRKAICTFSAA